MSIILNTYLTDVGLRSNPRQIAGHGPACWDNSYYKCQDLAQPLTEWWCQAQFRMNIVKVNSSGEQWLTRAAPTCWYSTEVGWTTSRCAPRQYMPTDAAVGPEYSWRPDIVLLFALMFWCSFCPDVDAVFIRSYRHSGAGSKIRMVWRKVGTGVDDGGGAENAGVENTGAKTYGKPSEQKIKFASIDN